MAATNKTALLEITQKEFAKLQALVRPMDAHVALKKRADDTSIKDVIAHRAHWIALFLGWYAEGLAGRPVFLPAEGYTWRDLKRYNADLRAQQQDLGWAEALAMLSDRFAMLTKFIENHCEQALYGGPMQGAKNAWTLGRWAEAAGASHFRSASKYIRACLRSDLTQEP